MPSFMQWSTVGKQTNSTLHSFKKTIQLATCLLMLARALRAERWKIFSPKMQRSLTNGHLFFIF